MQSKKLLLKKKKKFPDCIIDVITQSCLHPASPLEVMHPHALFIAMIVSFKFCAYLMMLHADFNDVIVLDGV